MRLCFFSGAACACCCCLLSRPRPHQGHTNATQPWTISRSLVRASSPPASSSGPSPLSLLSGSWYAGAARTPARSSSRYAHARTIAHSSLAALSLARSLAVLCHHRHRLWPQGTLGALCHCWLVALDRRTAGHGRTSRSCRSLRSLRLGSLSPITELAGPLSFLA